MNRIVKKIPIPIVGLMLGLAACGNLVLSYGDIYRNIFGIISGIILLLVLIKIIMYPKEVKESLNNPVVASVFPTFSMAIMLLATYLKPYAGSLALGMWVIGIIIHLILMLSFTKNYVVNFNVNKVFPSWFIVYVGIVVSSVTSPAFNMIHIGQIAFWFGFISYFILLPIVLYRVTKVKNIPEPALPTIVILSAPASLCLAGYMNAFQEKNLGIVYLLLALSQITYILILLTLPKLLKFKFYPSYSAFTFPLVISGISLKLTDGFLTNLGNTIALFKYLVKFEEIVAVVMVLYVLFRYLNFLLTDKEAVKG
jgi:exfoliative toxin A/B